MSDPVRVQCPMCAEPGDVLTRYKIQAPEKQDQRHRCYMCCSLVRSPPMTEEDQIEAKRARVVNADFAAAYRLAGNPGAIEYTGAHYPERDDTHLAKVRIESRGAHRRVHVRQRSGRGVR